MASLNKRIVKHTHEGGKAYSGYLSPMAQLRRTVMSCFLWEQTFYEDGVSIADRIQSLATEVSANDLAKLAIEARTEMNLRHVPLLLLSVLCRTGSGSSIVSETFPKVIKRADELAEFCVVYASINGQKPDKLKLSAQAKKGLAKAFENFNEYDLSKYNRDGAVKLRDVMFMCHPKPSSKERETMYARLAQNELKTADTWEVALSSGADKKETFERLISEGKLGYMALLRNLRNMTQACVDKSLIKDALLKGKRDRILPFRFVAAARACPSLEPTIDAAMMASIDALPMLKGRTIVLVDVSGSMNNNLSSKSDMTRMDAACALASIINADDLQVFSFSSTLVAVPPRKGMAGIDAIQHSQRNSSTRLMDALTEINNKYDYDRIIVITDEQTHDGIAKPKGKGYLINVGSYQNGVGYGEWLHIDGFSENVLKYIYEVENGEQ